jgi:L-lysine 2,3-aminomutase
MNALFERGIVVRNQSVLQRGVNDDVDAMKLLVKKLGHMNVQPVLRLHARPGEGRRGPAHHLQTAIDLEKHVRGSTAGFNTPTFVCDAPGGGGKRDVHSYELLRPHHRHLGLQRPERQAGRSSPTSIPSTPCPRAGGAVGGSGGSTRR